MLRKRALQVLLVVVGVAFIGCLYPLVPALVHSKSDISLGDQMILGIYAPIGVFLLLAVKDPASHRSLILCIGWSTLAHDAVMWIQAFKGGSVRGDWPPLTIIAAIFTALIVLAPAKQARGAASAARA